MQIKKPLKTWQVMRGFFKKMVLIKDTLFNITRNGGLIKCE